MPEFVPRLPARPSFEQLQKQAKELLRQVRAGDQAAVERLRAASPRIGSHTVTLADAQFVLAREYGFENWANLKHHIESERPPDIAQFEWLAEKLATAHMAGDAMALREINWNYGTSFVCDYHEPVAMQRRLVTWFASEARTPDLALADARQMVAHSYGFASWAKFVESVARPREAPGSAPAAIRAAPSFYRIDWKENTISVGGPMSDKDWDTVASVMKEHQIGSLNAGGASDAALDRISRLDHITRLDFDGSMQLTDRGLAHLARLPRLEALDISGWKGQITDRGLAVLQHLRELKRFKLCWQQNVTDAGVAHLALCDRLESVNLMGTPTGDGAIRALAGKRHLSRFQTGRSVTDEGLALLHQFPVFKTWQGGEIQYGLMSADAGPNHLMVDGPFTNAGIARLVGLDGVFALSFFWHCPAFTGEGLEPLKRLPNLGFLGCGGERCNDESMRHIAAMPHLRMLMAQGTVAADAGFAALSRSPTIEYIWGRECPHLTGQGLAALAAMPALRGLAVSCKNVDDGALSTLPRFPALRELMPMDVSDAGFRHVGRCERLENLWCMHCRDTGDTATEHIAGLSSLKAYYAGQTQITDRSLETLGRMTSLERLEFWACAGITHAGLAHLAGLPRLREIRLDGLPGVTRQAAALFPAQVRVKVSA